MCSLAYFISPHGFGHAARACAVMSALKGQQRQIRFEIFTEVPEWFFAESLPTCFNYHRLESDVGLVQKSSLEEDLEETAEKLDSALLTDSASVDAIARHLESLDCQMVVADISPLGLAVATRIGLKAVLIENFTWDWIYTGYSGTSQTLHRHALKMADIFAGAGLRIQTEPVCNPVQDATTVPPVARIPRSSQTEIRRLLEVPAADSMVLLSMGGVPWNFSFLDRLECQDLAWIVVPGGADQPERRGRLLLLPFHSDFYHPDLVFASDLVVGKLGYSTVAEAFAAGSAFAFIARPRFPESRVLAQFVRAHLRSEEINADDFAGGRWFDRIAHLLDNEKRQPGIASGAEEAAAAILAYAAK
jgi:hypothetical protein